MTIKTVLDHADPFDRHLVWVCNGEGSKGGFCVHLRHFVGGVDRALDEADAVDFFVADLFGASVNDLGHTTGGGFHQVLPQCLVVDLRNDRNLQSPYKANLRLSLQQTGQWSKWFADMELLIPLDVRCGVGYLRK